MSKIPPPPPDSPLEKLRALIRDMRVAMFTTTAADGRLHARPMAMQEPSSVDELWFFTSRHNLLTEEIDHLPQIGLSYSDPARQRYVAISGSAKIIRDEAQARELWNPWISAWFPKGPRDPDLRLIRVTAERVEYWDASTHRMALLFESAKAALGGTPRLPATEHATVDLPR
jgi:general stress protein 26